MITGRRIHIVIMYDLYYIIILTIDNDKHIEILDSKRIQLYIAIGMYWFYSDALFLILKIFMYVHYLYFYTIYTLLGRKSKAKLALRHFSTFHLFIPSE